MQYRTLPDMGNMYLLVYFGLGFGIFSFIVTVLIEAAVMKKILQFPFVRSIKYSFLLNSISAILGYPLITYIETHIGNENLFSFRFILLLLLFTIAIEFILLLGVLRLKENRQKRQHNRENTDAITKGSFWPPNIDRIPTTTIFGLSIVANLASYGITFLALFFILFILVWL